MPWLLGFGPKNFNFYEHPPWQHKGKTICFKDVYLQIMSAQGLLSTHEQPPKFALTNSFGEEQSLISGPKTCKRDRPYWPPPNSDDRTLNHVLYFFHILPDAHI